MQIISPYNYHYTTINIQIISSTFSLSFRCLVKLWKALPHSKRQALLRNLNIDDIHFVSTHALLSGILPSQSSLALNLMKAILSM